MNDDFDWYGDDDSRYCPECGERMQTDTDGDGVMTMSYEFCENCGTKDYGEPVRLTEGLIRAMRAEEASADPRTPDTGGEG